MEINIATDINGIGTIKITPKLLDDVLLWRINQGILNRDGLRLIYDKMPDGSLVLKLLVSPHDDIKFAYDPNVESEYLNNWNDFRQSIR